MKLQSRRVILCAVGTMAICLLGVTSARSQSANAGTFTMTQIDAGTNGINAKFHGSDQFCTYDGQFGGIRDIPM